MEDCRYNRAARCLKNTKYHVKTSTTYSCHNHTLYRQSSNTSRILKLVCYNELWSYYVMESSNANMVENGARCSDKNVKILVRHQWIGTRPTAIYLKLNIRSVTKALIFSWPKHPYFKTCLFFRRKIVWSCAT